MITLILTKRDVLPIEVSVAERRNLDYHSRIPPLALRGRDDDLAFRLLRRLQGPDPTLYKSWKSDPRPPS